jgi:hypothetical protein
MVGRTLWRAALATAAVVAVGVTAAQPAGATTGLRSFSVSGTAGEAFTARTVTGQLTLLGVPVNGKVIETGSGVVDSTRAGLAALLGRSSLHPG